MPPGPAYPPPGRVAEVHANNLLRLVGIIVGGFIIIILALVIGVATFGDTSTAGDGPPGGPAPPRTPNPTGPSDGQPVHALADNPLHADGLGIPAFGCDLPTWQSNPAGAETYFTGAMECLEGAWQPVMARAGLAYVRPSLQFPAGESWQSPCGAANKGEAAAFYCLRNHTIYMPYSGLPVDQLGDRHGVYLHIFAHEWGHAAQGMSGVAGASWDARFEVGVDTPTGLELGRRSELQATCFSGMFFGATVDTHGHGGDVTESMGNDAYEVEGLSDSETHGSGENRRQWWLDGYGENLTPACNTWAADSDAVA